MLASSALGNVEKQARRNVIIGISTCFLLSLSIFVGCGETSSTGEVVGSVSYKGKAVFPGKILLRSQSGKGLSANLNGDGEFKVFGIEQGENYSVAVEAIKLSGIGSRKRNPAMTQDDSSDAPLRREDTVPEKFRQANINFPRKYSSFETSGLSIDCSNEIPREQQVFELR